MPRSLLNNDVLFCQLKLFFLLTTYSVAKLITPSGANEDLNLNADLFVMYGVGPNGTGAAALAPHVLGPQGNPRLSDDRINAAVDNNVPVPVPVSIYI